MLLSGLLFWQAGQQPKQKLPSVFSLFQMCLNERTYFDSLTMLYLI